MINNFVDILNSYSKNENSSGFYFGIHVIIIFSTIYFYANRSVFHNQFVNKV